MGVYVGMDVHRKRSQVALVDEHGVQLGNRNLANNRPVWSRTAATCRSRWVSTPTVTGVGGAGMLSNVVPSGLLGQGRHAPAGTADSTATGPLAQAPDLLNPARTPGVCSP